MSEEWFSEGLGLFTPDKLLPGPSRQVQKLFRFAIVTRNDEFDEIDKDSALVSEMVQGENVFCITSCFVEIDRDSTHLKLILRIVTDETVQRASKLSPIKAFNRATTY